MHPDPAPGTRRSFRDATGLSVERPDETGGSFNRTIGDRLDMTLCSVELISKHFRKDKLTKHGPDYRDHDTTEKSKSHVEQTFLP